MPPYGLSAGYPVRLARSVGCIQFPGKGSDLSVWLSRSEAGDAHLSGHLLLRNVDNPEGELLPSVVCLGRRIQRLFRARDFDLSAQRQARLRDHPRHEPRGLSPSLRSVEENRILVPSIVMLAVRLQRIGCTDQRNPVPQFLKPPTFQRWPTHDSCHDGKLD